MIGHFIEKETRLLELSKRGGETTIGIQTYGTFSKWLFGRKLLTTCPLCRIVFTAGAVNAIRHGEHVVTSMYH